LRKVDLALIAVALVCVFSFGVVYGQSPIPSLEGTLGDYETELLRAEGMLSNSSTVLDDALLEVDRVSEELDGIGEDYRVLETELAGYKTEPPSEFASLKAFWYWNKSDNTASHAYVPDSFDCEDFALMKVSNAWQDGFLIGFGFERNNPHSFCVVPIGNVVYKLEPQNNLLTRWFIRD